MSEMLPAIADAKLPARYEAAKVALASCADIDECKDWADKAAALASYAKQAEDDELLKHSRRIQARALDRCGELLRQIEAGKNRFDYRQDGGVPPNRITAASKAGLSERQRKTALRINNIPRDEFEDAVESDDPPTITELAERGTQHSTDHLRGRDPADFQAATALLGLLHHIIRISSDIDFDAALRGLSKPERADAIESCEKSAAWLNSVIEELENV
jgi:hypothetical protein